MSEKRSPWPDDWPYYLFPRGGKKPTTLAEWCRRERFRRVFTQMAGDTPPPLHMN